MKKTILLLSILSHFCYLFAQKGVYEIGINGGITISSAANFKATKRHWNMESIKMPQFGLTFGYKYNDFYTLRLGINFEQKGFKDSTIVCGHSWCHPGVEYYIYPFLPITIANEFHFLKHRLIAQIGVNYSIGDLYDNYYDDYGLFGGIGTTLNLTRTIKLRFDTKFNKGLKFLWLKKEDSLYMNGFKGYNISTGLIYAFEKKKK